MALKKTFAILAPVVCLAVLSLPLRAGVLSFNFSGGDGGFTNDSDWSYGAGSWNLASANNLNDGLYSPVIAASGGEVTLQFTHTTNFESSWDGGVLGLSVGGGAYTYIPASSFSANGYNAGTSIDSSVNTNLGVTGLLGNVMFSGNSGGTKDSVLSLGSMSAGDTFQFRFLAASDGSVTTPNPWVITSASLTGVAGDEIPEPATFGLLAVGLGTLLVMRRRRA
jgi:hypothetical protein